MAGLEVDGVEPVARQLQRRRSREVVECGQHPNADKLRVTKVNVGGERLLDYRLRRAKLPSGAKGRGSHHRRRAAGRFQNQGREAARRAV